MSLFGGRADPTSSEKSNPIASPSVPAVAFFAGQTPAVATTSGGQERLPDSVHAVQTETALQKTTLQVGDIMTPNPVCVQEDYYVKHIAHLFEAHKVSSLPVLNVRGDLVGLITPIEVGRAAQLLDKKEFLQIVVETMNWDMGHLEEFFHLDAYEEILVKDIMLPNPLSVPATTPVQVIAQKMVTEHLHRALVLDVDGRHVVGIVSSLDIVKAYAV